MLRIPSRARLWTGTTVCLVRLSKFVELVRTGCKCDATQYVECHEAYSLTMIDGWDRDALRATTTLPESVTTSAGWSWSSRRPRHLTSSFLSDMQGLPSCTTANTRYEMSWQSPSKGHDNLAGAISGISCDQHSHADQWQSNRDDSSICISRPWLPLNR